MELLTAILAAAGLLVFFWALMGLTLFPIAGDGATLYWWVDGSCRNLEYRLRGYLWLLHSGLCCTRLVVVDCGLESELRHCLACLLRRETVAVLVDKNDLEITVRENGTRA